MILTPHFSLDEFRCRCGRPDCAVRDAFPDGRLLETLEAMRTATGAPIVLTSGLRCATYNRQIGGHPESEHLTGEAADIACDTAQRRFVLVGAALEAGVRRIGLADRFVHVGVATSHPQSVVWLYGPSRFAA